jgi:hypothetical protein
VVGHRAKGNFPEATSPDSRRKTFASHELPGNARGLGKLERAIVEIHGEAGIVSFEFPGEAHFLWIIQERARGPHGPSELFAGDGTFTAVNKVRDLLNHLDPRSECPATHSFSGRHPGIIPKARVFQRFHCILLVGLVEGVGEFLDNYATQYFHNKQLKCARLSVSPQNNRAIAFYKKMGWKDLGPRQDAPEVNFMEKILKL